MNGRSWDEGQGTRDKGQAGKNPVRDKLSVENAYSSFFYPVRDNLSVEKADSSFFYPVRDKLSVENAYSSFFYPVRDKLSVERSFAVLQFCSFAVSGKAFWNYPSRDNK
jgi:hypothetical protein